MTARNGSTIGYTSHDLPSVINPGSNCSTLYYGADGLLPDSLTAH